MSQSNTVALFRGDNLRLYKSVELSPHAHLNLITGSNAAGKTTLLEGLYWLGRTKSFRAGDAGELAGAAGKHWSLFAQVQSSMGVADKIGAGWDGETVGLRYNEQRARSADLARVLAIQLIDPVGHRLIEDGPGYRRSYLDWGVFHVEHSFLGAWQRYQRALRQRNQALRLGQPDSAVSAWDPELADMAAVVTAARVRHVEALAGPFTKEVERLLEQSDARLSLSPGWNEERGFASSLADQLQQHRRLSTTAIGPHRAELRLAMAGQRLKGRVSRGQQKLLVAALVLAQCTILIEAGLPPPVVLVDDFSAELSTEYQSRLATALAAYPGQVFVTAFQKPQAFETMPVKMFHVEHGRLSVVEQSENGR